MLELAPAAGVVDVVAAGGHDARRARADDFSDRPPREVLARFHGAQPDLLPGGRPGHEDGAAIAQATDPVPPSGDRRDRDDLAHEPIPSRLAVSSQGEDGADGSRLPAPVCPPALRSSASMAATTATGFTSASESGADNRASPFRSRYPMSMAPERKSGSASTRRWNAWEVGRPTITSSRSARPSRARAASRFSPHTMSFAMSGS